jgi:RNA ligase
MTPELLELIKQEVAAGYIRAVTEDNLTIYNYTPMTQYSKHWNEATMMCRGLILDPDGNIVARPFPKFFNWGEVPELHSRTNELVYVTEKMDGSLGILYNHPSGEVRVATRGSFSSEQAQWATQWLHSPGIAIPPGVTPLVEIIYPGNRIVVDYGDQEYLMGLAFLDNETGLDRPEFSFGDWNWEEVDEDVMVLDEVLTDYELDGDWGGAYAEGQVVRFSTDNVRVKFKYDDYVRLHKLITGTNAKYIWQHMAVGDPMDRILDNVPDEFYKWAKGIIGDLTVHYSEIEAGCMAAFDNYRNAPDRKTFAELATKTKIPDILFAMYDNKPYEHLIWKRLKPAAERPFRTDIDG